MTRRTRKPMFRLTARVNNIDALLPPSACGEMAEMMIEAPDGTLCPCTEGPSGASSSTIDNRTRAALNGSVMDGLFSAFDARDPLSQFTQVADAGNVMSDGNAPLDKQIPTPNPHPETNEPSITSTEALSDGDLKMLELLMEYKPGTEGYHLYVEGPNLICPAEFECSAAFIADQMTRYAVPGRSAKTQVENKEVNPIYDPRAPLIPGTGDVQTFIYDNGLRVINQTQENHVLHDGAIIRTAYQKDGAWYVMTVGVGNNLKEPLGISSALIAYINNWQGPKIFEHIDNQIRQNILRIYLTGHGN